jgi:oligosaccharyltransferase complex subunit beta
MVSFIALLVTCLLAVVFSMPYHVPLQGNAGGKRTLVLLDSMDDVATYSLFFGDLASRGHVLSYFQAESPNLALKQFGESLYDNVLFFAPSAESFSTLSFDDFVEFVQEGGNILLAANRKVSDSVRDFLESFGVSLDKKDTEVIDHFEREDSLDTIRQHTTILAKNAIPSPAVLGDFNDKASKTPVLFKGIGHKVARDNILAVRILRGNPSTYSYFPNKVISDGPESAGSETLLVSGVQGRNNARVVIAGSLEMFSNKFFGTVLSSTDSGSGNREFCQAVSKWGFREAGVLRFRNIVHHKSDGTPPDVILHEKERPDLPTSLFPDPEITRNSLVYRIKDEIVYSMIVERFEDDEWQPFCANDMQMEFVMLDAYVLKTMTCDPNAGKFVAQFVAPDSYGVFKFRVLYRREGWTVLHAETQVSIRPFKHNEYERFIFSAYPYYASAFSATAAVLIFTLFFLFSSDS